MRSRAHLGVEAVGFGKFAVPRLRVASEAPEPGSRFVQAGLVDEPGGLKDCLPCVIEQGLDRGEIAIGLG